MIRNATSLITACGKVMFLHLFVILFTGGRVGLWVQGVYTPSHTHTRHRHPGRSHPPLDTPRTPPPGTHTSHYSQRAGGAHHTGMHSCFLLFVNWWQSPVLITARKQSLGQGNIFSSMCQEFSPHGGGSTSVHAGIPPHPHPQADTLPRSRHPHGSINPPWSIHHLGADTPPPHCAYWQIWSTSGQYASYWNAICGVYYFFHRLIKQECIPVVYVPATRWLYARVCFPGGCVCSGGCVCPRGGVCSRGGDCLLRGCLLPGGVCSGGCLLPGGIPACTEADPPVNKMTDACENITLAQLRCSR